MNTILFLAGCGVGAFACCIAFIVIIMMFGRNNSKMYDETKKQNDITASLMRERNELDRIKVEALSQIAARR